MTSLHSYLVGDEEFATLSKIEQNLQAAEAYRTMVENQKLGRSFCARQIWIRTETWQLLAKLENEKNVEFEEARRTDIGGISKATQCS
jgi:hypothetical protein